MKYIKIFILMLIPALAVSQTNLSVPLNDPVYIVLENAIIRNLCPALPTSKPYSRAVVIKALKKILINENTTALELKVVKGFLDEFEKDKKGKWYLQGRYRYDNKDVTPEIKSQIETEDVKTELIESNIEEVEVHSDTDNIDSPSREPDSGVEIENNKEDPQITVEIGGNWRSEINADMKNHDFDTSNWLGLFLQGDLSKYLSYNLNIGFSFLKPGPGAYAPYSFSQNWDGYLFLFDSLDSFGTINEEPSAGIKLLPELSASFLDNKVGLNFSRVRRDWGIGEGNLMLSKTARPFAALDGYINPVDWFNLSFITGVLEYQRGDDLKDSAADFQNFYSAAMIEFFPTDWFYFAFYDAVIWPKRFEIGYLMPGLDNYLYQNMIGDFDNMQLGFSLDFKIPKYGEIYYNMFIDEVNFLVDDFFHRDRNMYTWQLGSRLAVPGIPFSTITFQYTKVEPYMYTHPPTDVPWYDDLMDTSYKNHGEPLGYKLDPNSDEILFQFESVPSAYVSCFLKYRMIRHFADTTPFQGYGNSYDDYMVYTEEINTNPKYAKHFLKDGVYEWFHILSIGARFNAMMFDVPIAIGAEYSFDYKYHTDYIGDKITRISNETFFDESGHCLKLYFKIY